MIVTTRPGVLVACVVALTLGSVAAPPSAAQSALLPSRGEPAAPVVVLLFSDFQCAYCAQVEPVLLQIRQQFPKDVQVVFKHNPLPVHPQAALAHEAAVEASRQGKFWEMHDVLFANQQKLGRDDLLTYAAGLGLDMAAFTTALDTRVHKPAVDRDLAEARALGVTGTPTLFINGRRFVGVPAAGPLVASIKSLLTRGTASEGMTIAADAFDLNGSPFRGPKDAPVTIVEYSDFQCGFCARASGTVALLVTRYSGRVRWVKKHYPLDFHLDAPLAHRAALAAHAQGKFWEMHDALFANQRGLKREDLLMRAAALGLDLPRFTADLDSDRFNGVIERDRAEGARLEVDGTPTFFVNGKRLVGAVPYETIAAAVDRALGARAAATPEGLEQLMSRGPADAPVTIRWFADLTSALHRDALVLLRRIVDAHPSDVRVVLRLLPSPIRDHARTMHEAAVSSAEQGAFWQFHDVLMNRPNGVEREALAEYAARLGLNRQDFVEAMGSDRPAAMISRHASEAKSLDVRGTPTFFVNDIRVDGVVAFEDMDRIVVTELKARRYFD